MLNCATALTFVAFHHHPSWSVADAEIQHLPTSNHMVQRVHDLRHGSRKIPGMNPEQVDIISLQPLQTRFQRKLQVLARIASKIASHLAPELGRASELGSQNNLISIATLRHPLANPLLGLAELVQVGRVDEVAALLMEVIEDSKSCLLVALAHERRP